MIDPTTLLISSTLALWGPSESVYFCKCICFSNYTIVPLYRPEDESNPCQSCTKQFCLDQQLEVCRGASLEDTDLDTGTGDEGDVKTKCFQRDSLMARSIITIFVLITACLLIGAFFKKQTSAHLRLSRAYRNEPVDWRSILQFCSNIIQSVKDKIDSRRRYNSVSSTL